MTLKVVALCGQTTTHKQLELKVHRKKQRQRCECKDTHAHTDDLYAHAKGVHTLSVVHHISVHKHAKANVY